MIWSAWKSGLARPSEAADRSSYMDDVREKKATSLIRETFSGILLAGHKLPISVDDVMMVRKRSMVKWN
jgi:hypothetical protein